METLISLRIEGAELELVEGRHFPSQVKAGNHRPGMHLDDLET